MITKSQFENRVINGTYKVGGGYYDDKEKNFEISPMEFLEFSKNDLKEDSNLRNLVNALSNVKRALDCQVETIIVDYGYFTKSKKERWNFPKKLDFIKDQGIIAPMILKKINSIRNLLEHEFKKPSLEEVEDALDIVTLFISYVGKLSKIPNRIMLYRKINGNYWLCFK